MSTAHEFVIFKFNSEVSLEEQKNLMAQIDNCAKKLNGFLSRDYYYSSDSAQWIDHVKWENHESAKKASEAIMNDPEAGKVFSQIDNQSITMSHFDKLN